MSTFIKPLSQNDLANGWRLEAPRVKRFTKEIYNDKDNIEIKVMNNIYRSKINLLQLPRHLHHKQRRLYNGNIKVVDNSHHFYIEPTTVDKEIKELISILDNNYDIRNTGRINTLLKLFQENDVHGWPVIVASQLYNFETKE